MIKILDVCSGIGGFSLGLEATGGFDTVAFCEYDEFCGKVLNKHWPDVPIYKDLKEIGNEPTRLIQEFDLICGGIPCQPFSLAGKQKGKEDDRHLWPYMYEIIKHKKPTWVIVENVGGFVNVALDDVCLDLETEGYATQSFIIPACGVEAPHRRERVWILGKITKDDSNSDSIGSHRETINEHGSGESNDRQERESGSVREVLANGGDTEIGATRDVEYTDSFRIQQHKPTAEEASGRGSETSIATTSADVVNSKCNEHIEEIRGGNGEEREDEKRQGEEDSTSRISSGASGLRVSDKGHETSGHVADSEFKGLQGGKRNSQGEGRKVLSPEQHNRDEVWSETGRTSGVSGESKDVADTKGKQRQRELRDVKQKNGEKKKRGKSDRRGSQPSNRSTDVANSNDNGHEGGLSETRNQDVTGQDSQSIGATDTKDSVGQGHDGGDSQQPGADGVVSRSSDDRETVSSGATGVRGLSKESNDNEGTSREDGLKEDNNRALVQEGQSRVQSSIGRGLGSNQASSKGTQVRQGTDNNQVDRVGESKDVADSSSEGLQGHRGEHGLRETGEEEQTLRGSEEQDVPNTESVRGSSDNNNGRSTQSNREGGVQSESGGERSSKGTGEDVPHSGGERGRSGQADRQDAKDARELTGDTQHREGNTQPGLGGMDDGVSARLDGHQGFITEPDIPRVAEKIPDRVNRLKALGNSIVPQIIYHIGMAILEEERKNELDR